MISETISVSETASGTRSSRYQFKSSRLSSHGRILQYLSQRPRSTRILDVGTANGYIGRGLQELGFQDVTGLEQDPLCVQAADGLYAQVIQQDLDQPWTYSFPHRYDVILCADVLEHLKDPQKTLEWLLTALKPDGRLLLSIPNSAHWWVRLNVLAGRFPMEERGLFDSGHLRFFTWSTIQQLIRQAGLTVEHCWITPIPFSASFTHPTGRKVAQAGEWAYLGFSHAWKKLFAYQFVLSARLQAK